MRGKTYKIVNHYGIQSDGKNYRNPLRALKEAAKREGDGWEVYEYSSEEAGRRIEFNETKTDFFYL